MASSSFNFSKNVLTSMARYLLVVCLIAIIACNAVSDSHQQNDALELSLPFPAVRMLHQAKRHINAIPIVEVKRQNYDFGWDQCEFSPMSCLLRKRRAAGFQ